MANRNYSNSRIYTMHVMPVLIDCQFTAGASGAVSNLKGPLVQAVTRKAAGIYEIRLQDKYSRVYSIASQVSSGATGSAVTAGSFVAGTAYVITTLGTTNYNLIGVPSDITPAVGMSFVATGIGSGTGTAKAATSSGIIKAEVIGDPNLTISTASTTANQGGVILIQTMGATATADTALIATDPAVGSLVSFQIYVSNSSIIIKGE